MKKAEKSDLFLFEPRPAVQWKSDLTEQRYGANRVIGSNRDFIGANPQGGTAIHVYSKTDLPRAKIEFLQGDKVVSTINADLKAGLNRFQWNMRGPVPPANPNARRPGPAGLFTMQMVPTDPNMAPLKPEEVSDYLPEVPFVAGGAGEQEFFRRTPQGPLLGPGVYMIRLTAGGKTLMSSVDVQEDTWMIPH